MRRSWRLNRTATYWPPLLWPSAFLSHSPGLLNRRPGVSAFLGHVPQSSILSLTRLIPSCHCSIGGLGAHSAGCWLSLPHLVSNWSGLQTAQSGAWGPTLLGAGFLYSILSPTGLVSKLLSREPEGPLCWVLAFLYSILSSICPVSKRIEFPVLYNILIIPQPDAPVIYIGAFPILTGRLGRRSIYNMHSPKLQHYCSLPSL